MRLKKYHKLKFEEALKFSKTTKGENKKTKKTNSKKNEYFVSSEIKAKPNFSLFCFVCKTYYFYHFTFLTLLVLPRSVGQLKSEKVSKSLFSFRRRSKQNRISVCFVLYVKPIPFSTLPLLRFWFCPNRRGS